MFTWRPWHALLAGLTVLGVHSSPAQGQQGAREPALNWVRLSGAEGCISAAQLAERVEQRLQRVIFVAPSDADFSVDGSVAPAAEGYVVRLQVSAPDGAVLGQRDLVFPGPDCAVIDEAIVLVIAVTLYPDSALGVPGIPLAAALSKQLTELFGQEPSVPDVRLTEASAPPEAESAAAAKSADDAHPKKASASTLQQGPGTPLGLSPFFAAGVGLGHLPALGLQGTAGLGIRASEALRLELAFSATPEQVVSLQGGRVHLGWAQGTVSLCPWRLWAQDTDFCLGAELGFLSARAEGYPEQTEAQRDLLLNGRIATVYRPRLWGMLHLRLALAAAFRVLTRAYEVQGVSGQNETAFRTGPLTARAEFGLLLAF